jgi:tRNA (mo5U34)-methyltransferase
MGRNAAGREDLREQVGRYQWVHSIDLGDGIVTPGEWGPPNPYIMEAFDEVDFSGKKVLDIGCWDGLWSFEAEKRGAAEVYATDIVSQRWGKEQPTFKLAHEVLKSRARYYPTVSVFDVERLGARDFDVVIYCGIYYHLKNPLLAFTRLRKVMREGGTLIVEGPVIENTTDTFARFSYRTVFENDPSNWWVPTVRCLEEWVECSFFDLVRGKWSEHFHSPGPTETITRYVLTARAVRRKDPGYVYPDEELRPFDLNEYA